MKPSAPMGAASAMEALATVGDAYATKALAAMEAASAVKALATVKFRCAAECRAAVELRPAMKIAIGAPESAASPAALIEARAPIPAASVPAMEPRAGANKYAAVEVIRAVVAVGHARVRGISIIAVRTIRRRPDIRRNRWRHNCANSDAPTNRHLSIRRPDSCRQHQNSQCDSIL